MASRLAREWSEETQAASDGHLSRGRMLLSARRSSASRCLRREVSPPRSIPAAARICTCTSQGDDLSGRRRRRQGVNRPDDTPAGRRKGAGQVPRLARPAPLAATGNPCASRMIPLESPVPEIGPPGSESGGRKRAHGNRTAARLRKHRMSPPNPTGYAPPLDSTAVTVGTP